MINFIIYYIMTTAKEYIERLKSWYKDDDVLKEGD
jgi:hypothetical protein